MAEEERLCYSESHSLSRSQFRFRAQPAPWWDGVELYGITEVMGTQWLIEDIVFRSWTQEMLPVEPPTIKLSNQAAQVLMDDLWASGIRPSEKRDMGPGLEATRGHLADMQKIAFRLLDDKLA